MPEHIPVKSAVIRIQGMKCPNCVGKVQAALAATAGVAQAQVDLPRGEASVTFNPAVVSIARLMDAIAKAGFEPTGFTATLRKRPYPPAA